jgi:hypothetical protein
VPDSVTTLRLELIAKLASRLDSGAGFERRKRKKVASELPQAVIRTRITNSFRKEDTNTIVTMLQ